MGCSNSKATKAPNKSAVPTPPKSLSPAKSKSLATPPTTSTPPTRAQELESSGKREGQRKVGFADDVVDVETDILVTDNNTLQAARDSRGLTANIVQENFDKDIRKYYHIDWNSELGSGLNGIVRICRHMKTGIPYALKTLVKKGIPPKKYAQLKEEIKIMQTIDHPHILRIHEYFETRDHIYLITEICSGGELYKRLMRQDSSMYSEQTACQYISIMLGAVAFLHAHNIVHRDLKLENFLFENQTESSHLKLIGLLMKFITLTFVYVLCD